MSLPVSISVTVGMTLDGEKCQGHLTVRTGDGSIGKVSTPWVLFFDKEHTVLVRAPEGTAHQMSAKTKKRRSATQERKRIEGAGGRSHVGSGAFVGHKSDGSIGYRWRMENKFTTHASYRVSLDDLTKLRGECINGQAPVFNIDFQDKHTGSTKESWVLVPHKEWERLEKQAAQTSGSDTLTTLTEVPNKD